MTVCVLGQSPDWARGFSSCYLSCRDFCGVKTVSFTYRSSCYCDESCLRHGDCCLDYEAICLGRRNDTKADLVRRRLQRRLPTTCITLVTTLDEHYNVKKQQRVRVVTGCLRNEATIDATRCRSATNVSTLAFLDSIVYRSVHCLRCNNELAPDSESSRRIETVPPRIFCGQNTTAAYRVWTDEGKEAFVAYVTRYCVANYEAPASMDSYARLDCLHTSECDARMRDDPQFESAQSACLVYRADVRYTRFYKNFDCARCNGENFTYSQCVAVMAHDDADFDFDLTPGPTAKPPHTLPSFELLMDFDGEPPALRFNGRSLCPPLHHYDFVRKRCLQPACGANDSTCARANAPEQMLDAAVPMLGIVVRLSVGDVATVTPPLHVSLSGIFDDGVLDVVLFHSVECAPVNTTHSPDFDTMDDTICFGWEINSTVTYSFDILVDYIYEDERTSFIELLSASLASVLPSARLENVIVLNHAVEGRYSCQVGTTPHTRHIDAFIKDKIPLEKGSGQSSNSDDVHTRVHVINGTHLLYNSESVPITLVWTRGRDVSRADITATDVTASHVPATDVTASYVTAADVTATDVTATDITATDVTATDVTASGITWRKTKYARICEQNTLDCETLTLSSDSYRKDDARLVVTLAGHEVVVNETDFVHVSPDTVVVCTSALGAPSPRTTSLDERVRGVMTLVGNVLSLVALAATVVTYAVLSELRTLPGWCVTSLAVALLLAQLTFQLSGLSVAAGVAVCRAVGAAQHAAWLAAFCWMNVLAFDTCRTFTRALPPAGGKRRRLAAYAAYAWGVPALVVGVCLAVDLATQLPFSYGGPRVCWISGRHAVLYAFALPIGVVIVANAGLFVRLIIALRQTLAESERARGARSSRQDLMVYSRLTSLMGFTWLFGFLANIHSLSFLWYFFIIFNTLQGVFIFVSFVLTKRVRQLYKKLWMPRRKTSEADLTTTQMTSLG